MNSRIKKAAVAGLSAVALSVGMLGVRALPADAHVAKHGTVTKHEARTVKKALKWHQDPSGAWVQHRVYIKPVIVGDPALPLLLRDHLNALVR